MPVFQWPYIREHYDGIDNPIYDQDIQVAMEAVLQAAIALTGLGPTDFAIISGMDFDGSTNYTAGYFYLNGSIYYIPNPFTSGQALGPASVVLLSEDFDDGNARNLYMGQQAQVFNAAGVGTSPTFAGNMDTYRIGGKRLLAAVNSLLVTAAALGTAAFLNVGTGANTVMAGNDPRAPYTAPQLDARYAQRANVIEKGTAIVYTPVTPNDPVPKGYVYTVAITKLASGRTNVGDIPVGGISITVSFGVTLPNTNYQLVFTLVSLGVSPQNDATSHAPVVIDSSRSTSSCQVRFQEGVGTTQDLAFDWTLIPH